MRQHKNQSGRPLETHMGDSDVSEKYFQDFNKIFLCLANLKGINYFIIFKYRQLFVHPLLENRQNLKNLPSQNIQVVKMISC